MAHVPPHPALRVFQDQLALVCQEGGWTKDTPSQKFVLFIKQVGEPAKAMRKPAGLNPERAKQQNVSLEEEFAEVFSYLLDLANCFDVDREQAFRAKEKINESKDPGMIHSTDFTNTIHDWRATRTGITAPPSG